MNNGVIRAPLDTHATNTDRKLEAFARLEMSRKKSVEDFDYDKERSEALDEKYGIVD